MLRAPTPPANKLLGLEALRFVAAFGVLIWHYQHFAYVADKPVDLARDRLPFYSLLQPFYNAGEYGVWIFWCISGFIFFWKYRDAIFDRSIGGWTFFVSRLSRLYPLHFATLMTVAILQGIYFRLHGYFFVYQDNNIRTFVLHLFMASAWGFQNGQSFNEPIWSISVEILVYIAFFLMLRFVTRSALLNVTIIILGLSISGQDISCLVFFYAGGLAAMIRRAAAESQFKSAIEGIAWLAAIIVPASIWMAGARLEVVDWMLLLIYTPILLFCLSGQIALSDSTRKIVETAGNMTYSSYLLHFPIQTLIAVAFGIMGAPIPLYDHAFFLTYIVSTLLASYFVYRYFEAPAQMFLRSFLLRARDRSPQLIRPRL